MSRAEQLAVDIENAFSYTRDNNRDLLHDELFSLQDVMEELEVEKAYQVLVAYIARHKDMIDGNLENA